MSYKCDVLSDVFCGVSQLFYIIMVATVYIYHHRSWGMDE